MSRSTAVQLWVYDINYYNQLSVHVVSQLDIIFFDFWEFERSEQKDRY